MHRHWFDRSAIADLLGSDFRLAEQHHLYDCHDLLLKHSRAFYLQLTEVEQAFKELKSDLSIRPVHHQKDHRIEAHIFISFLSYALQVTLKTRLKHSASGLTPRAAMEKFAAVQMLDVHLPATDGREIIMSRHTQPEKDLQLLLDQMKLTLPDQPPPKITAPAQA